MLSAVTDRRDLNMAISGESSPNTVEKTLNDIVAAKRAPKVGFAILLALYVLPSIVTQLVVHSEGVVFIMGQPTPLRTLAGAFSSIANLSIIFLVLFYGKPGFVVSLVILLSQFPSLIIGMIQSGNFTSIPGVFTNIFTIVAVVLIYRNNIKIKRYQQRIVDQAITDRMTGMPNRFARSELMDDLVQRGEKFAVACFNLNNFKSINNTLGPKTGNDVLVEAASRFANAANESASGTVDFVTYQGGDEFALIMREYRSEEDVMRTIRYYESALERKMTVDDCDFYLSACIGYAESPPDAATGDELMSHVDAATHEAKRLGSGERICRYDPALLRVEDNLEVERKLRMALEHDTLCFHLQPQYDMSRRLVGFEALARMKDDEGNFVSPAEFIPVAENAGIIDEVDNTVFRKSALFFGDLIKKTGTNITLSVNVSVKHLMKNDFLDEVRQVLNTCGVPANQLEIEITESIMIDSAEKALQCIQEVKDMGIKIAIDDFGTGYSSLSYLNSFPADTLKVDKSFIDQMNQSESSKQYVAAIISIGHVMNFSVISEGVEQLEQVETLRSIDCDYIQGFLWGRPMEPEAAEQLVLQSVRS